MKKDRQRIFNSVKRGRMEVIWEK